MNRLHFKRDESHQDNSPNRFQIDMVGLLRRLIARRRWIIGTVAIVTVAAVAIMLLTPNRYTSRAIILPSGKSGGNLSALTAMVGLSGSLNMSDENSSALFPLILGSHLVRDGVLEKTYEFTHRGESRTLSLPEYFDQSDPDKLRLALAKITSIRNSDRTGEIVVAVETEYPAFSQAIVQEYLSQLEQFNLHQRRSSAGENEHYLKGQVEQAREALTKAESELEGFRKTNANWMEATSPGVITQHARLVREMEIRNSAYLLLQEQYELAKLEAQKDIPIVNLLDAPSLPTVKSGPSRSITVLMAILVSLVMAVAGVVAFDVCRQIWNGGERGDIASLREDFAHGFPRTARLCDRVLSADKGDRIPTGV